MRTRKIRVTFTVAKKRMKKIKYVLKFVPHENKTLSQIYTFIYILFSLTPKRNIIRRVSETWSNVRKYRATYVLYENNCNKW